MGAEVSWQVELEVKVGELANFRALTKEMVEATKSEPGVLIYERFINGDGTVVQLYERYEDSAAAVSHLEAFSKLYGGRFGSLVDRKRFVVFGDPSPDLKRILNQFGADYFSELEGFSAAHNGLRRAPPFRLHPGDRE
jgi:quinol monooxygenase YgiN